MSKVKSRDVVLRAESTLGRFRKHVLTFGYDELLDEWEDFWLEFTWLNDAVIELRDIIGEGRSPERRQMLHRIVDDISRKADEHWALERSITAKRRLRPEERATVEKRLRTLFVKDTRSMTEEQRHAFETKRTERWLRQDRQVEGLFQTVRVKRR